MRQSLKPAVIMAWAAFTLFGAGCAEANSSAQINSPESTSESTFDKTSATKSDVTSSASVAVTTPASTWDIQAENSHIRFSALQEGEIFTGAFTEFSGIILFDPETPETGSVDISIPLKSVDAGSRDRNSTLPRKVWFSAKKFPEARFTSTEISEQDEGFLAKGTLMLKGITVPVELPFELKIDEQRAVMTAQIILDRTLWNVGAAPWDTDEWVSREVKLDLQVTADRPK